MSARATAADDPDGPSGPTGPSEPDGPQALDRRSVFVAALVAALLSGGYHLLFGDLNLNLRDEGYLWYGVGRCLAGEVPLRDFQAYDPGRYYWCAAWSPLVGSGILGVRAAAAIFQALGIFLGLLALRRVVRSDAWLVPAGIVLLLWSFPRHKVFEPAIALAAVYAAVRLLERPSVRTHFGCGAFVGLMACFGRNHGLYLGVAFAALIAYRWWKLREPSPARRLAAWGGGVLVGYAPVLAMLVFVPGFGQAFLDALLAVTEHGTNLPKSYPWPWRTSWEGLQGLALVGAAARDAAFLLAPLLLALGLVLALRTRPADLARRAVPIAASFLGLVYLHHVSVRSDLPHLAQSIHPILILALALPCALPRLARASRAALWWLFLLGLSVLVALDGHPELKRFRPGYQRLELVSVDAAGEELRLKLPQAQLITRVQELIRQLVPSDEPLFIAPTSPTFYPLLGKGSPTWWIYFLWPAREEDQRETIRRLDERGVDWALIVERPFDGRTEFNFQQTNPLVWELLQTEYELVRHALVPPDYFLFRRRAR